MIMKLLKYAPQLVQPRASMNVIRINWKLIRSLLLIVVAFYLLVALIQRFNRHKHASLDYDYTKREFQINVELLRNTVSLVDNRMVDFQIRGGLIRYSITPVEYWSGLLENAVKLGLNTIEIEVVWATHEPMPAKFEFQKESTDLELFIRLAASYRLFVIVRIDPYMWCADYDMGGLPHWLLGYEDLAAREAAQLGGLLSLNDPIFLNSYRAYLNTLLPIIYRNQASENGSIIAILIQHYGDSQHSLNDSKNHLVSFYGSDYAAFIQAELHNYGIVEMLIKSLTICELNALYCEPNLQVYLPVANRLDLDLAHLIKRNYSIQTTCYGK